MGSKLLCSVPCVGVARQPGHNVRLDFSCGRVLRTQKPTPIFSRDTCQTVTYSRGEAYPRGYHKLSSVGLSSNNNLDHSVVSWLDSYQVLIRSHDPPCTFVLRVYNPTIGKYILLASMIYILQMQVSLLCENLPVKNLFERNFC